MPSQSAKTPTAIANLVSAANENREAWLLILDVAAVAP
jgi:hypothetical protein